ncbi:MAG: UDP-N-acetylmuramoyl-tripeptide--D-alanyl-D-alanine ligase [Leeuwenhoekiella sp.]|uniref:UDP-N-acetylmuramoyl-tripeptide--D-alanyl-D- alanine ligase n=1 Tax=unclassified Leeuwenhoekiella TaxID=2615029 RepID=UPI000C3C8B3C|nr:MULTISPECIES: UDP-N-acetylmuramoyl-tripeptide--D-alanyl-D-alanine ligase [unclassified Leeuwenhoekiella]MAS21249.1 UDP-N-acetylmuramoyl-tripeptide--D-alanyl-D-alanine ligase [Leeuwenhoekiella sp.]MAW93889.1 UDP-N-acetylmuramoyl-tripeptide--D-alanyl-D-alanine ligase [Leeuwenhoekiella sp.]MBA81697.1 UDP-N-acetylmuramoyl-tripeptide--D-alanyl-D-alanine ligase [Leeuwenhoekiella sp.]|tara:strand:- start:16754 stop:18046 length:1293 start_codon:yes stop_codon:yes gene_type:complete
MNIQQIHNHFIQSSGVSTDTRKIKKKSLFFALKGENFNGNSFAQEALNKGAKLAIVDESEYAVTDQIILVEDVLKTLQELAHTHRKHLDIPIVALTGSNGKTTTKELINAVLSKKFKTVATQGNLNNHIGVPLTLLSMSSDTELGIVEMGANHQGEIQNLCEIADPDYGYITNFGKAHLEGFGGVEGVIKGKSELYLHLIGHKGSLILNLDDPIQQKKVGSTHTYTFGKTTEANLEITYALAEPFAHIKFGDTTVESNLIGQYNEVNLAAAAAFGNLFKIEASAIKEALESYIPSNNRSQLINEKQQTIILDAYNANPSSMEAALRNLATTHADYKLAILGDMFELGDAAAIEHQYIADLAKQFNINQVVLVGANFSQTENEALSFISTEELLEQGLPEVIQSKLGNATILVKGSRGMALERILNLLQIK